MRVRILRITQALAILGVIGLTSVVFLWQGSLLIRQAGGDLPVALAGPLSQDNAEVIVLTATPTNTPQPRPTATPTPVPAAPAPPPPGPCQFVLGFAFLHSQLGGIDGNCVTNEYPDPAGTGDSHQRTERGLMVWEAKTNTMRWTDGAITYTYSGCGLQTRPNTQTFVWETNPALVPTLFPGSPACAVASQAPTVATGAGGTSPMLYH